MTDVERAILRTVSYFSHFGYPLTTFEIWKWLMTDQPTGFGAVLACLATSSTLKDALASENGFWGLGKIAAQVEDRRSRLGDALMKYHKLARFAAIFSRVPWISGVAICNSLAFHHTTQDSDIDVFVLAKSGRVWSTRLMTTLPLMLLRQRPGECSRDPICCSFYLAKDELDFSGLKIGAHDPYLVFWLATLIPILDRDNIFVTLKAANAWTRQTIPHVRSVQRAAAFRLRSRRAFPWLPIAESWAERMQRQRFPAVIRELMNQDTRVVVTSSMLKFHHNDRREAIRRAHEETMAGYEDTQAA